MEHRRSSSWFLFPTLSSLLIIFFTFFGSVESYKNYTVGDSLGWFDNLEKPTVNYEKWVGNKEFSLGDFLSKFLILFFFSCLLITMIMLNSSYGLNVLVIKFFDLIFNLHLSLFILTMSMLIWNDFICAYICGLFQRAYQNSLSDIYRLLWTYLNEFFKIIYDNNLILVYILL